MIRVLTGSSREWLVHLDLTAIQTVRQKSERAKSKVSDPRGGILKRTASQHVFLIHLPSREETQAQS